MLTLTNQHKPKQKIPNVTKSRQIMMCINCIYVKIKNSINIVTCDLHTLLLIGFGINFYKKI